MADVSLVRQDVCMEGISVWLMPLLYVKTSCVHGRHLCMADVSCTSRCLHGRHLCMADVSLVRQDVCMEDTSVWLMSLLYVKMSAWKTHLYG